MNTTGIMVANEGDEFEVRIKVGAFEFETKGSRIDVTKYLRDNRGRAIGFAKTAIDFALDIVSKHKD